jgi:hypothetical protein
MRILSIHVLKKVSEKTVQLLSQYELGFVSFVKRPWVKQSLVFGARTCASKLKPGESVRVKLEEFENSLIYAQCCHQGMIFMIITDQEYPETAAKKVL